MMTFLSWLFAKQDSTSLRMAKLLAVFAAAGLGILLIHEVLGKRGEEGPPVPKVVRKRVEKPEAPTSELTSSTERTAIVAPSTETEVSRAMDETAARQQIARLRMAAASGDPVGREAASLALRRHARHAAPILDDELSREHDAVVRYALIEARQGLK